MQRRQKERLDYKIFATTGQRTRQSSTGSENLQYQLSEPISTEASSYLQSSDFVVSKEGESNQSSEFPSCNLFTGSIDINSSNMATESSTVNELIIVESILHDEIVDVMEDNAPDIIDQSPDLMKSSIQKIESLRMQYRTKHREMKLHLEEDHYEQNHLKLFTTTMESISNYIKTLNQLIQQFQQNNHQLTRDIDDQKAAFIIDEIKRCMKHIHVSITCNVSKIKDDELKQRKSRLNIQSDELRRVSDKLKELIGFRPKKEDYTELKWDYESLVEKQKQYEIEIDSALCSRELDKLESFKMSKLNINLQKFSGYDSPVDIFTFKSDFDKLYSQTVPKALQPDLLKNNHLDKTALNLVRNVTEIEEIWLRLKNAFGNREILLAHKISQLTSNDLRHRDPMKVFDSLSKITNSMRDLMQLATVHNIENELYYGDAFTRIINLLGESRMTRWLTVSCDHPKEGKFKWKQLMEFLEKEMKIQQQKSIIQSNTNKTSSKPPNKPTGGSQKSAFPGYEFVVSKHGSSTDSKCIICGSDNHVQTNGPRGSKLVQYFACKKFVDMSAAQRFQFLQSKGLCHQCLYPGAQVNQGKHKEGRCQHDFICKHLSHSGPTKKHVLVCDEHKNEQQNKDILEHYKARCIVKQPLPQYSKDIKIYHSTYTSRRPPTSSNQQSEDQSDEAVFMLQGITINKQSYTIFYDDGCCGFISRHEAIQRLGSRATQQFAGTIKMGGVGCTISESHHGIYKVSIPLRNGNDAIMTGPCLDQITQEFPHYPLNGEVIQDIRQHYQNEGFNSSNLPTVPETVGGHVDFMVGIKYLRYFPKAVFQMPSGLTIYESHFFNSDGSCGVIGGPHRIFNSIKQTQATNFIFDQLQLFHHGYHVNPDLRMLGYTDQFGDVISDSSQFSSGKDATIQAINVFNEVERAGSEILYRCVDCRGCTTCLNQSSDIMSIREETEQELINKSVTVDIDNHISIATLPLMYDPTVRLVPNRDIALKVYNQQINRLSKNLSDKDDILKSEKKLQLLGYVAYIKDLPEDQQQMLRTDPFNNFIPWRAVWKENSLSTPCRVVFDASMPTKSGYSLNDLLAKGRNNMNRLVDIFVRWRAHKVAFHTDVQKMYNSVRLHPTHWGLQRYLWQESLDPSQPPEEKVIKTLIYGVKSSGNQAERGLRETARLLKDQYPAIHQIITKDIYVDDCLSGSSTTIEAHSTADQLELVVNEGGYTLKGFTFSGKQPQQTLSSDGESVSVAGLKWKSEEDIILLDVQDLNFAKKYRGRKPVSITSVPVNLTRRQCVSKVAELYDITGLITPIIATLKIDLHELVKRKMDWDDILPENLRSIWVSHFEMMTEIKNIHYKRAVIPTDAANLNGETLDFGDASQVLVCAAIYIRFKRRDDSYSCQLIFARSRIVPDGYSQPRAELFAAVVNTHTGEIIKRAFGQRITESRKFTDSQICLYWICNTSLNLKQWTRNRVTEILRFTNKDQWSYVKSQDMIADLGTRRCTSIDTVKNDSVWINGFHWMQGDCSDFPAQSTDDISLNAQDIQHIRKESKEPIPDENLCFINSSIQKVPEEVSKFYKCSNYLIDPNYRCFQTVVRIMAYVMIFINNCRRPVKAIHKNSTRATLSDEDIQKAEAYFYQKATQEIKMFTSHAKYKKISHEREGILYYTGRILPTDEVSIIGKATNIMKDLSSLSFYVPLVDKNSPLAYSIISDIHWNHPTAKHSGVETTWRYVLQKVYVIEGRSLVKMIRSSCSRCRYLMKQQFNVSMGPLSQDNFTIAPAFFCSQVDLAGPFQAFSQHHRRTTVKIWLIVFCCTTTTATKIKVMEDYSSTSFILAFTRLSCEVGFPKKLLADEGSQLVKGCESMRLNFMDLKHSLYRDMKVDFNTCPVGGHNMHGRVERKIREIRLSIEKSVQNQRLSILHWETLASSIANSINNLPLAIRNFKGDFEVLDLITPNRLLMGRNNDRCPTQSVKVTNDYDKMLRSNKKIFDTWFECWLTAHVPCLMYQPKWFDSDRDIKPGDVVLFVKQESSLNSVYQYGMVKSIDRGRDDKVRKVIVSYQNSSENVKRETSRSVRSLVLIHGVDEIDINTELYNLKI